MDLSLVFSLLLNFLLVFPFIFQEAKANQDPYSEFSDYLKAKDAKEHMKLRRQHARVQPISLKPPPQDWPEPVMAPGDFIAMEQSEATSLSPLLAYQLKLEQEYARQKQLNLQEPKENSGQRNSGTEFTSSEEDLQKLLDPDELVKHNKQLRPFVTQGKELRTKGGNVENTEIQGKPKLAGISSLTALKAKTDAEKTRKAKTAASRTTTTIKPRRGRRKKTEKKVSENRDLTKEPKKKRKKSKQLDKSGPTTRKRRKRIRTFAFAEKKFDKYESTPTTDQNVMYRSTTSRSTEIPNVDFLFGTVETSTAKVVSNATTTPDKTTIQGIMDTTNQPPDVSNETTTNKNNIEQNELCTTTSTPIEHKLDSNSIKTSSILAATPYTISTTLKSYTSPVSTRTIAISNFTRNEVREKRKEIKLEMEKVLEAEELEKSFGDTDSGWTTSEKSSKKVPLHLVTPRHALMGILKQGVVKVIDKILRDSPKLPELQEQSHREDSTKL